jgi:hypothetical protein
MKVSLLITVAGLLLAFLVGAAAGTVISLGELNSLKAQLSTLQGQVATLTSENGELRSSLEELNRTVRLLAEALRNKTAGVGGLYLEVEAKDVVSREETVQVNLTLTNLGAQPVALTFPSSKVFDFKVVDRSGKVVFRWSQDEAFLTVVTQIVLGPGESKSSTLTWKCELPEGEYAIVGIVETYNATITCSKPIKIAH